MSIPEEELRGGSSEEEVENPILVGALNEMRGLFDSMQLVEEMRDGTYTYRRVPFVNGDICHTEKTLSPDGDGVWPLLETYTVNVHKPDNSVFGFVLNRKGLKTLFINELDVAIGDRRVVEFRNDRSIEINWHRSPMTEESRNEFRASSPSLVKRLGENINAKTADQVKPFPVTLSPSA